LITCAFVCACARNDKQQEQQTENTTQEVFVPDTSIVEEVVSDIIVEVEQPTVVESKPIKEKPVSRSSSYSGSSSSSFSSGESDYWEEKRKHSPNDNYLLGFDEDVDDVHDMELYMEDY
jgi:hypothetical protein